MAKRVKQFPSDFSKSKPSGSSQKDDHPHVKKQRKSKRSFLQNEETGSHYSESEKQIKSEPRWISSQKTQPKPQLKNKDKGKPKPKNESQQFPEMANPYFKSEIKFPKNIQNQVKTEENQVQMPLNKFVAHCGICSRRDAVDFIKRGKVTVNQLIVFNPAIKVSEEDSISFEGKQIFVQKKMVYYLLNKPKNYICTTDDPEERNTVLDLFQNVDTTRLYPVGRLDRNTTGLLLLTNDGDLAQKLSHPKFNIKKIYQVTLDKPLSKKDFDLIADGVILEDGPAPVDEIAYINGKNKKEIGIQIHIGRNRIVRRIFEHLQYKVTALDRVVYAGLTKKNIPRGTWRELNDKEVIFLKHFT